LVGSQPSINPIMACESTASLHKNIFLFWTSFCRKLYIKLYWLYQ